MDDYCIILPDIISIHALREEGDGPSRSFLPGCRYFYPRPPRGGRRLSSCSSSISPRFLSTPSARRATGALCAVLPAAIQFLSTPSARRATDSTQLGGLACVISIHALREEGDRRAATSAPARGYFYPRPPRGGRLICMFPECVRRGISIHALREEGDLICSAHGTALPISIHALREEGDPQSDPIPAARHNISIHALREEGDPGVVLQDRTVSHFYPRPPRGGRPKSGSSDATTFLFLSTPSARRATPKNNTSRNPPGDFYPRPPRGGRPNDALQEHERLPISIHALREEGDLSHGNMQYSAVYFYPRPPRGGRRVHFLRHTDAALFLSTPSARRATPVVRQPSPAARISIHALREEGDAADLACAAVSSISIHALREEGDHLANVQNVVGDISIHALREEGDPPSA